MRILTLSLAAAGFLAAACAPVDEGGSAPMPPDDGPDQCKASQYQRYIGTNRSELPPRPADEVWRVTCTTCPTTRDLRPDRLNVRFDQATGVIESVDCG